MCASMDTKISYDKHGGIKERFVKGNIPNDGLMALLYAYIAYKSKITDNFSNMDPRLKKDISKIAVAPVLGFSLPRMK